MQLVAIKLAYFMRIENIYIMHLFVDEPRKGEKKIIRWPYVSSCNLNGLADVLFRLIFDDYLWSLSADYLASVSRM